MGGQGAAPGRGGFFLRQRSGNGQDGDPLPEPAHQHRPSLRRSCRRRRKRCCRSRPAKALAVVVGHRSEERREFHQRSGLGLGRPWLLPCRASMTSGNGGEDKHNSRHDQYDQRGHLDLIGLDLRAQVLSVRPTIRPAIKTWHDHSALTCHRALTPRRPRWSRPASCRSGRPCRKRGVNESCMEVDGLRRKSPWW